MAAPHTVHPCGCISSHDPLGVFYMVSECANHKEANSTGVNHQIKVSYWTHSGYESKAYIDERPNNGVHYGTNKHTDLPVIVVWDEKLDRWQEISDT